MGSVAEVRRQRRRRPAKASVVATVAATLLACEAFACGYENPQTVALGSLNWIYPKALYVGTSVWQAEDAGLLPSRQDADAERALGFYRAAASMKRLGELLGDAPADMHFSVVLIPQVMWTRFAPDGDGGITVETHADSPSRDGIVIVTNHKVVRALVGGTLSFSDAEAFGLLRLYGDEGRQADLRTTMARALKDGAKPANDAY